MTVAQNIQEVMDMIAEASANGDVFFRFSECIDTDIERQASRNWGTGETEPGISVAAFDIAAINDSYDLGDQLIAVQDEAYRTNGMYILTGICGGHCTDGYPTLIADTINVVCEVAADDLARLGVTIRNQPAAGYDFANC